MFDLEIFPGCVTKLSGLIIICKVSGPVDRFRIIRIQRILYECPPRLFRRLIITKCQRRTCYAKFPLFVRFLHKFLFFVQQEYFLIRKRNTDRKNIPFLKFPVDLIICAVTGDFRRSVQIDKLCLWQVFSPDIQMLDRHHFSAEQNFIDLFRYFIIKSFQCGNDTYRRNRPDQSRHITLTEII